jgi:hypothetical protein
MLITIIVVLYLLGAALMSSTINDFMLCDHVQMPWFVRVLLDAAWPLAVAIGIVIFVTQSIRSASE